MILAFDTETSGLDASKHKVLTMYMAVLDDNLNQIDDLDLKVKPDDDIIPFEQGALDVNGIDLQKHIQDPETIPYSKAVPKIQEFLSKHSTGKRGDKLDPAGHNIDYDINMITGCMMSKSEFETYIGYRKLDTSTLVNFLKLIGWFPKEVGKLTQLAKHLNVPLDNAHNAKADTQAFISCLRKIVSLFKDKKSDITGIEQETLLMLER